MTDNTLPENVTDKPSFRANDELSLLYHDYQKGKVNDRVMHKAFQTLVAKIAYHVSHKFQDRRIPERTQALQEDISQEIWMLLITKVKVGYDIEKSTIAKYLYASTFNKTVDSRDLNIAFLFDEHDPSAELTEESLYQPYHPDFEADADRDRAFSKIRNALALRAKLGIPKDQFGDEPKPVKPKSSRGPGTGVHGSPQYTLTQDQEDLREILNILKLETDEAARLLGIKRPTLSSYLYGKTSGVPLDILDAAHNLLGDVTLIRERDAYVQDMKKTIKDWCLAIGVSEMNLEALSNYLGVHLVTLQRWQQGETRPSISSFKRHYRRIMNGKT